MRLLAWIAAALFSLMVLAGGLLYWGIQNPAKVWNIVKHRVLPENTETKWESADFVLRRISWTEWRVEWSMVGFEVSRTEPQIAIKVNLQTAGRLFLFRPRTSLHLETFELSGNGQVNVAGPDGEAAKQSLFQVAEHWRQRLVALTHRVRMDKAKIDLTDWQIKTPDVITATLSLQKPSATDPTGMDWNLTFKLPSGEAVFKARSRFDLIGQTEPIMWFEGEMKDTKWLNQMSGTISAPADHFTAQVKGSGRYERSTVRYEADIKLNKAEFRAEIKGDANQLSSVIPFVRDVNGSIHVPLVDGSLFERTQGTVKLNGKASLAGLDAKTKKDLERHCECQLPDVIGFNLNGSIFVNNLVNVPSTEKAVADFKIQFDPLDNPLLTLKLNGNYQAIHATSGAYKHLYSIDGDLRVKSFQKITPILESRKIMVPAPFDRLDGTVSASVKASIDQNSRGFVVPMDIGVDLKSQDQKVNVQIKSTMTVSPDFKTMDLLATLVVNDFIIDLPPFDPIQGLPKLTKDERIVTKPDEGQQAGTKLRIVYGIKTTRPGAIRLRSPLARPHIPMTMDVSRNWTGDTGGTISLEPFVLEYFHRTVHVDQLRVVLDDRQNADYVVDGRLHMEQAQYKITMVVSGTLRQPMIKLASEPDLSRADIISVLLYGRTTDKLSPADRETVGNFDAAVADRAIGLIGLWVFASTPIQSFSYNPTTKVYTATVQLASGTTASVGTDWEEAAHLEVRKRVTKSWVLTATWNPATEVKPDSGKVILQWEKRF